ncbi:hypothetical protein CSOJ01_12406 [Colletotrichum sojae]|uniref:Uncharacterized protein n=1 Tax=Colletotrichum sojae TaxID=2175907 RepID=A0A8H6IVC8_9PEZI|nr:hypothetical protein CSOJ01_12406 [Colletotrichum sojae]
MDYVSRAGSDWKANLRVARRPQSIPFTPSDCPDNNGAVLAALLMATWNITSRVDAGLDSRQATTAESNRRIVRLLGHYYPAGISFPEKDLGSVPSTDRRSRALHRLAGARRAPPTYPPTNPTPESRAAGSETGARGEGSQRAGSPSEHLTPAMYPWSWADLERGLPWWPDDLDSSSSIGVRDDLYYRRRQQERRRTGFRTTAGRAVVSGAWNRTEVFELGEASALLASLPASRFQLFALGIPLSAPDG